MYQPKDFKHLLGMEGMSDALLTNHFTLYEGYVKNTNAVADLLKTKESGTPEYAELKRRFGWEWNGMRLHELYFGNLAKASRPTIQDESVLAGAIQQSFGSFDAWKKDFIGTGTMRGIGWVILAKDSETGALFNTWIDEHNTGNLAGATPLLVMDVFEHAFMLDYGLKRADYIETFFRSIDWDVVEGRF